MDKLKEKIEENIKILLDNGWAWNGAVKLNDDNNYKWTVMVRPGLCHHYYGKVTIKFEYIYLDFITKEFNYEIKEREPIEYSQDIPDFHGLIRSDICAIAKLYEYIEQLMEMQK